LKILTAARGIGFPYARQIVQITRERVVTTTGDRSIETVYAICSAAFELAHPRPITAWRVDNQDPRPDRGAALPGHDAALTRLSRSQPHALATAERPDRLTGDKPPPAGAHPPSTPRPTATATPSNAASTGSSNGAASPPATTNTP